LQRWNSLAKGIHKLNELFFQEEHFRRSIIQNVGQFIGRKSDVERQQNRTSLQHSVICFEKSVAIEAEKRHPIARLHTCISQGAGKAHRPLGELRIGVPERTANDSRFAGELSLGIA
jgi:hypothetical protein